MKSIVFVFVFNFFSCIALGQTYVFPSLDSGASFSQKTGFLFWKGETLYRFDFDSEPTNSTVVPGYKFGTINENGDLFYLGTGDDSNLKLWLLRSKEESNPELCEFGETPPSWLHSVDGAVLSWSIFDAKTPTTVKAHQLSEGRLTVKAKADFDDFFLKNEGQHFRSPLNRIDVKINTCSSKSDVGYLTADTGIPYFFQLSVLDQQNELVLQKFGQEFDVPNPSTNALSFSYDVSEELNTVVGATSTWTESDKAFGVVPDGLYLCVWKNRKIVFTLEEESQVGDRLVQIFFLNEKIVTVLSHQLFIHSLNDEGLALVQKIKIADSDNDIVGAWLKGDSIKVARYFEVERQYKFETLDLPSELFDSTNDPSPLRAVSKKECSRSMNAVLLAISTLWRA